MLKSFTCLMIFLCISAPSFAALNESTKPSQVVVYLDQNLPYSGFNSHKKAQGLYADFWLSWSLTTGIAVKMEPYLQEDLYTSLVDNRPALYSGLQASNRALKRLNKTPLLNLKTDFYHFSPISQKLSHALTDHADVILVGGLFPQAQKLPLFVDKTHLIYKEYPGVLELLIDLYQDEIDAVVIFNFGLENKGLLDSILSSFLQKKSANDGDNQLFAYLPVEQQTLVKWLQWGNQFEQLNTQMRTAFANINNPWWGASAAMARNLLLISGLFLIFT